jgi:predicted permease
MLLTLIGSVPTAANAVMFAESYDIEPEYASAVVGIGTVLSTATIPVVCWVVNFFL